MRNFPYFKHEVYMFLKYVAQIFLPAVGTLYFALGDVWHWPNKLQVVGTITAVDTFLGVLLQLSTSAYNSSDSKFDGAINITQTNAGKNFSLDLDSHPDDLEGKNEVLFKVNKPKPKKAAKKAVKKPAG